MNIDDIKSVPLPIGTSLLAEIFRQQRDLMVRYDEIESRNGFEVPHEPWHLDDKRVQARIKDLCWRATEEFAEASEERFTLNELREWRTRWDSTPGIRHFMEELADAVHFMAEASIVAGIVPDDIHHADAFWNWDAPADPSFDEGVPAYQLMGEVIFQLGLACNCLKNKPWKLTQVETDRQRFAQCMIRAWCTLSTLWEALDVPVSDVYRLYARKNAVNKFRQGSNY